MTKNKATSLTLYLNPEKMYFQLFKKNLEHSVNVVRFSKNQFCLLESPPWVKWQSYLLHLEGMLDGLIEDESIDFSEHIATLIHLMSADFSEKNNFDGAIYSFKDHHFLDLMQEKLSQKEFDLAKKMVLNDMSFFHLDKNVAYLARATVNYTAQLAGHIFHSLLSRGDHFLANFPGDFTRVIWQEAVAFFLSKLVNPHRKSLQLNDIKKQLAAFSGEGQVEEALKLALDQKMKDLLMSYGAEEKVLGKNESQKTDSMLYYKASKILGALIGERIYQLEKTGLLSRQQLLDWLRTPLNQPHFNKFYVQVLRDIDRMDAGDIHG